VAILFWHDAKHIWLFVRVRVKCCAEKEKPETEIKKTEECEKVWCRMKPGLQISAATMA